MITFEVKLPSRSLCAFFTWFFAIPPCVLAFILAASPLYHETNLYVPLYTLASFLILECFAKISSGFFATYWVFGSNWAILIAEFVLGAYWIAARFMSDAAFTSKIRRYEISLMVLWALNLTVSSNVQTILLYAAHNDPVLVEKVSPDLVSPMPESMESWSSRVSQRPAEHAAHAGIPKIPKQHRSSGSLVSFKRKHKNHQSAPVIPSLAGLEAVPEGFADLSWDVGSNVQYIVQNSSGSRNVSGSTQQSGLFGGSAEYNRRITSAGFLKDEPTPQTYKKLGAKPKSQTFSHYDKEQTRLQEII